MKKKLIFPAVTLILALSALWFYARITAVPDLKTPAPGAAETPQDTVEKQDTTSIPVVGPSGLGLGRSQRLVYTRTDRNGRIRQKFGYDERLASSPDSVRISKPWVQIFSRDQRLIVITADAGTVPVETEAGEVRFPERGELEDVRIEMYRLGEETGGAPPPPEPLPASAGSAEMTVRLAGPVQFELEFSRLNTGGGVEVLSPRFAAQGAGLSLEYDQVNECLRQLELRQVERVWLTEPGELVSSSPQRTTAAAGGSTSPAGSSAAGRVITYRLTLSDQVRVARAEEEVLADNVEVIADVNTSRQTLQRAQGAAMDDTSSTTTTQAAGSPTGAGVAITCTGPLRIELADDRPAGGGRERLEFVARGQPARIYRGQTLAAEADEIRHDQAAQTSLLQAGPDRPVRLMLAQDQWATARQSLQLEGGGLATLLGPGTVQYLSAGGRGAGTIDYAERLRIKLASGGAALRLTNSHPEWIEFQGGLTLREPNTVVQAEQGRLTFFPPAAWGTGGGGVESAGARPEAQVRSLQLRAVRAQVQETALAANELVTEFALTAEGRSQPRNVTARGDVQVETPEYLVEASESLELVFALDSPASGAGAAAARTAGLMPGLQLERLAGARADGPGGKMRLVSKKEGYEVRGDQAERAEVNRWTISGRPARVAAPARQEALEGELITADLERGEAWVAGPGQLDLVLAADLLDPTAKERSPMHVAWQEGARYELKTGQIELRRATARVEQGREAAQVTQVACPRIWVQLAPGEAASAQSAPGTPAGSDWPGRRRVQALTAGGGSVQIVREEYGPEQGRLRRLEMQAAALRYDESSQLLTVAGPGWVQVDSFVAEAAARQTGEATTARALQGLLGEDRPTRSFIQFGGQMRFERDRRELVFTGGVALDQVPLGGGPGLTAEQSASALGGPGVRRLDCEELIVRLAGAGRIVPNGGMTEGPAAELGQPAGTSARGRVFAEAILEDGGQHFLAGESLRYESGEDLLTIEAGASGPALLDGMQFQMVRWNRRTGRIEAIPLGGSLLAGR